MTQEKERTKIFLTEEEAAEFLRVAERTLRDWRQKGRINNKGEKPPKAYIRGKHIYYSQDELIAWIREGATNAEKVSRARAKRRMHEYHDVKNGTHNVI